MIDKHMKSMRIIVLIFVILASSCMTTRISSRTYHQNKDNLKHDQRIGLLGIIPIMIAVWMAPLR